MAVEIKFDTDNDAFQDGNLGHEVRRILEVVSRRVEDGVTGGACVDSNGNVVGTFEVSG